MDAERRDILHDMCLPTQDKEAKGQHCTSRIASDLNVTGFHAVLCRRQCKVKRQTNP